MMTPSIVFRTPLVTLSRRAVSNSESSKSSVGDASRARGNDHDDDDASWVWTLEMSASPSSARLTKKRQRQSADYYWENRFTPQLIADFHAALDAFEADAAERSSAALLIASRCEKFFSNGHDFRALEGPGAQPFVDSFYALLARIMCLGAITVAEIGGHAFAGGCLLAMAADYRVMRADRGYMCMNEIDLVPSSARGNRNDPAIVVPGSISGADKKMMATLLAKLPKSTVAEMMLTGRRYGGSEAFAAGLVQYASNDFRSVSLSVAANAARKSFPANRRVIETLKREMHAGALDALRPAVPVGATQSKTRSRL